MKPEIERIPITPEVSTELRLWRGPDPAAPALLVLPAMGIPAGAYRRFCEAACARGNHVLCLDLRGVGSSSIRASRRCDWGYEDLVNGELAILLSRARLALPQAPLYWFCHSLGGHLAVIHTIEQLEAGSEPVAGLILAASGSPQAELLAPKVRNQARFLVIMVKLMLATMGVFRGDWVGFGGRQAATLMREWALFVGKGIMPLGDRRLAAGSPLPMRLLALSMDGDSYSPKAAVASLMSRLDPSVEVETIINPGGPPPGHTDWLKQPNPVVERLSEFLATAR